MKVCRICMTKDDKLYPISSNGLFALYGQLTGVQKQPGDDDRSLPQWVCEECGLRLMSYDKLRQKSLRAQHILLQLIQRVSSISEDHHISPSPSAGHRPPFLNATITEDDLTQIDGEDDASEDHVEVPLLVVNYPDNSFILKEEDTTESSLQNSDGRRNVSQSNDSYAVSNDYTQEDNSELDRTILEDCPDFEINTEQYNNALQSNVSNTGMEHDNIQDEHEDSSDTTILEDNLDVCEPSETRLEHTLDIQELETTNGAFKSNKIKEFVIDLESGETPSGLETNNDTLLSETLLSDTENYLGSENDLHPDPVVSNLEEDNILDLSSLKAKIKENYLEIKQVDNIELLKKKLPHRKVKKVVVNKKATKQKVVTKKVDKPKVDKNKVDSQKVVKEDNDFYHFDNLITIQTLSMEEQIAEFEQRKYSRNYISKPFKCYVCYKSFYTQAKSASHTIMHSDKGGEMECTICKLWFSRDPFKAHMKAHKYVFTCRECTFKARHWNTARKHVLEHKGKVYKCSECDLEFKTYSTYSTHRRISHVSKFVCKYCGFSFVADHGLRKHLNIKHQLEKKVKDDNGPMCEICNVKFVSAKALNTHLRVAHPEKTAEKSLRNSGLNYKKDKMRIVCDICGVQTGHGRAHYAHYELFHPSASTPLKRFICEQCGKGFKTKYHHNRHLEVHSERLQLYKCDECGSRYTAKQSLKSHILNQHLTNKPKPKKHACSICGKEYISASVRNRHMTKHSGQKAQAIYPCTVCGNLYTQQHALKRHTMIVHSGQRAFSCDTCGRTFTAKHKMREHIEHLHMNVPRPTKKKAACRRSSRRVSKKNS